MVFNIAGFHFTKLRYFIVVEALSEIRQNLKIIQRYFILGLQRLEQIDLPQPSLVQRQEINLVVGDHKCLDHHKKLGT